MLVYSDGVVIHASLGFGKALLGCNTLLGYTFSTRFRLQQRKFRRIQLPQPISSLITKVTNSMKWFWAPPLVPPKKWVPNEIPQPMRSTQTSTKSHIEIWAFRTNNTIRRNSTTWIALIQIIYLDGCHFDKHRPYLSQTIWHNIALQHDALCDWDYTTLYVHNLWLTGEILFEAHVCVTSNINLSSTYISGLSETK